MRQRRVAYHPTNQIVGQKGRPELLGHHRRRLAAHVIEVQRLLDVEDVEFHVPAETVEFGDVLWGVFTWIDKRGDNGERLGAWSRSRLPGSGFREA